jgi:hypothetical protein
MIALFENTIFEIKICEPSAHISECIVIYNSKSLNISSGITGKVMKICGITKIKNSIKHDIDIGDALITPAYNMTNYDYLINACGLDYSLNPSQRLAVFAQSFSSSLDLAYRNGLKSITFTSFPEYLTKTKIGTISNIFFKIAFAYIKKRPYIKRITLLADSNYDYDIHSSNLMKLL